MAVPASLTYVNLQGTYVNPAGQPISGRVLFTPDVDRIVDGTDNTVVVPTPVQAVLDANGHFTVSLMAENDASGQPTGWTYEVREQLRAQGGKLPETRFHISITTSMAPGPVYLADIDPTTPVIGESQVYVATINGDSGEVELALADLGAGNSATRNVGTTAGTVAAGDDSRIVGALQRSGGTLTGALVLANQGSAPGTPTGGGVLYVQAGSLKFKGSGGSVTVIAPA